MVRLTELQKGIIGEKEVEKGKIRASTEVEYRKRENDLLEVRLVCIHTKST